MGGRFQTSGLRLCAESISSISVDCRSQKGQGDVNVLAQSFCELSLKPQQCDVVANNCPEVFLVVSGEVDSTIVQQYCFGIIPVVLYKILSLLGV